MGFSEHQVLNHQIKDGFRGGIPSRDEFGLPPLKDEVAQRSPNPFVDKMKNKVPDSTAQKVFEERSSPAQPIVPKTQVAPDVSDGKNTKENSNVKGVSLAENPKGDPMPEEVQAVVLDPISEEKTTAKVQISYPSRPLYCSGCCSLGHTIGACPRVNRVWVIKEKKVEEEIAQPVAAVNNPTCLVPPVSVPIQKPHTECSATDSERWTEVKRKKGAGSVHSLQSDDSPTPPQAFKNLRNVDEIDKKNPAARISKSQKKKLKLQQGRVSPSSTH
ncbi:hypothetical protein ACET3Z_018278 [Daucus carota]